MDSKSRQLVILVTEALRARKATVSFAESCTGGLVSSMLAALPGVSDVYMGSVVAYSNAVKEEVLRVPLETLKAYGAVSEPTAKAMALGATRILKSNWAVSITGIAGPGGGTAQKPVGTVCFGVAGPSFEWATQKLFNGDREEIQKASADFALSVLLEKLLEKTTST